MDNREALQFFKNEYEFLTSQGANWKPALQHAIDTMQEIEDGLYVKLPCKDNQTVYAIIEDTVCEVFISEVSMHYGHKDGIKFACLLPEYDHDYFEFYLSDYGKTVFLTEAEALKAKEGKENG